MSIRISGPTGKVSTIPQYYGELAVAPTGVIIENSAYANTVLLFLEKRLGGNWVDIYRLVAINTQAAGSYYGFGAFTYA